MLDDNKKLEYRKRIGQGLAVAREDRNLTQIEVGKSGIIRSNRLSQIELGKVSITAEEFVALCEYYKTTPDMVLGIGSEQPTNLYQYKVNQLLADMSSSDAEMVFRLLDEYKKRKK